jgi:Domain of unknown function (DUF1858)
MPKTKTVTIEPDTTLEALLGEYPELEPALCDLVPMFGKLKPGAIRETIAKTTTLEQAATASGVRLPDLVSALRKIAGMPDDDAGSNLPGMPLWVSKGKVKNTPHARPGATSEGNDPEGDC